MEFAYLSDAKWEEPLDASKIYDSVHDNKLSEPQFTMKEELKAMRILEGKKKNEISEDKRKEVISALRKAESTYRRMKISLTNESDYGKAGSFFRPLFGCH